MKSLKLIIIWQALAISSTISIHMRLKACISYCAKIFPLLHKLNSLRDCSVLFPAICNKKLSISPVNELILHHLELQLVMDVHVLLWSLYEKDHFTSTWNRSSALVRVAMQLSADLQSTIQDLELEFVQYWDEILSGEAVEWHHGLPQQRQK